MKINYKSCLESLVKHIERVDFLLFNTWNVWWHNLSALSCSSQIHESTQVKLVGKVGRLECAVLVDGKSDSIDIGVGVYKLGLVDEALGFVADWVVESI